MPSLSPMLGSLPKRRLLVRALDWLFLAGALALAAYGQLRFGRGDWRDGTLYFGAAMICFAWAVRRVQTAEPATVRRPAGAIPRAQRLVGLVIVTAALGCLAGSLWIFRTDPPTQWGWTLYLFSMGLFVLGFVVMEWRPTAEWLRRQLLWLRDNRWELFLLLVIVLVGGTVRLVGLEIMPLGIWFDESDNAVIAREILQRSDFRPLYATTLPSHYLYLMALAFKLFGVSAASMRLASALLGTGTIVAMWLLGRELGGRWVGLLAAALLAASHWAINFSRIAMHGISTPFFGALALYWLLRGLRAGSRTQLALGGLALGLGLAFYAPFRLLPFAVIVFVIGKLLCERGFLKNGWLHMAVFILASIIAFGPTGQWALRHPQEFFGRTKQTSVFTGKAPEQRWPALKSNIRLHLLMFNYQGDRNGRHNLPNAPMVDPIAGAVLPLGAALALARLHRPRQLLLLAWAATMLSGGIFSLDFEAPQALRAIGAMAPIFLLIAQATPVIVDQLILAPARAFGGDAGTGWAGGWSFARLKAELPARWLRWATLAVAAGAVLVGLAFSVRWSYETYFVRFARNAEVFHAFNAREAVVARRFNTDADKYRFYTIYEGHPTVRFLATTSAERRPFQPTDDLPVRGLVERDVLYMLEPEFAPSPDLFKAWYPDGTLEWYQDVAGRPMLFTYFVSKDEVNGSQGARFRLFEAADREGRLALAEQRANTLGGKWDEVGGRAGLRGEWTAQVYAPASGTFVFHLRSATTAALTIDDRPLVLPEGGETQEARALAKGWHTVRLVADAAAGNEVRVEWTPPNGQRSQVPREALSLRPPLSHGLYGAYYQNLDWKGTPAFGRVDWQVDFRWHIQPLHPPFSVEWQGGIKVDQAGVYILSVYANAGASLELNGNVLIDSLDPPYGAREIALNLEPGIYPARVRYREPGGYSEMRLRWRTPGAAPTAIPAENLVPKLPAGVVVPNYTLPAAQPTPEPQPAQPPQPAGPLEETPPVEAQFVRSFGAEAKMERPRALAVGPDGHVYVADAAKAVIYVFDAKGKLVDTWGKGKLREPSDLATAPDGTLYVLDTVGSQMVRFGAGGKVLSEIGKQAGFYSPRGLALAPDGSLVIADTGSNRLVVMSPDGEVKNAIGAQGGGVGQFQQPVDVAVGPDGAIYAADTMLNRRVQVLGADGKFRTQWLVPWVNEFLPPAMAVGKDGRIYMVDTLRARVWEYASPDAKPAWWQGGDLRRPVGLALGEAGAIYLLDEEAKQVYQFTRP